MIIIRQGERYYYLKCLPNNGEERKEDCSLTQSSQGIPCQSEHGLLAEHSVRDASLTDDARPTDISPG